VSTRLNARPLDLNLYFSMSIQATKSNLLLDIENMQQTAAAEIEDLEKTLDSLREEHQVVTEDRDDARSLLTKSILEQEELSGELTTLRLTYDTFKKKVEIPLYCTHLILPPV
jgi:chromosome segregation ATPase